MTMSPKVIISALLLTSAINVSAYLEKVVYGDDNRVLAQNSENSEYKKWATATAAMISNSDIRFPKEGDKFPDTVTIYDNENLGSEYRLCKEERFRDIINPANCSGFLVEEKGQQYLITAGHCIDSTSSCTDYSWVFGFTSDTASEKYGNRAFLPKENVYKCAEVVEQVLQSGSENDYAVIKLDRVVENVTPLSFRKEGKVDAEAELVVIGHPSGLPTVIDDKGSVRDNDNEFYIVADLDTFGGNSGSAVINASTGEVEGILVRGETDYQYVSQDSENGSCRTVNVCEDGECRGEDVTRITNIELLTGVPGPTYDAPVETNGYERYTPWTDPDHWYGDNYDYYNDYDEYDFLVD